MAVWMLSVTASAIGLSVVGLLAERGLHAWKRATRWVWLLAMIFSVVWPFASGSIVRGSVGIPLIDLTGGDGLPLPGAAPWVTTTGGRIGSMAGPLLLGSWCLASVALLVVLLLSSETLKADRRHWRTAFVAGHRVSISGWLGPAVIGVLRPEIVLPSWALDLDEQVQHLVVLHEHEHVRGGDSRLLAGGLALLVLMPWCPPLWWQFYRLRMAIETDCDRRLLLNGAPAREYARALLTIADGRRTTILPLTAMFSPKGDLERRIRLIAGGASQWGPSLALPWVAAAVIGSVAVAAVPLPQPPIGPTITDAFLAGEKASDAARPGPALSGGRLPGDPGDERLFAELRRHHSDAISSGLPQGSVIWFVADQAGSVAHTGIVRGKDGDELQGELRRRYPEETSDFAFRWSGVSIGATPMEIVWLLPPQ